MSQNQENLIGNGFGINYAPEITTTVSNFHDASITSEGANDAEFNAVAALPQMQLSTTSYTQKFRSSSQCAVLQDGTVQNQCSESEPMNNEEYSSVEDMSVSGTGNTNTAYDSTPPEEEYGFIYEDEEDMVDQSLPTSSSTTGRILSHLHSISVKKVNKELGNLRCSLHEILDEQLRHVEHLVSIANGPSTPLLNYCEVSNDAKDYQQYNNAYSQEYESVELKNAIEDERKCKEREENEKNKYLIELFTNASVISSTLQRKEFRV